MSINRQIFITIFILITSEVIFRFSNFDIYLQNFFYNFDTDKWIISYNNQLYRAIFYSGLKKVIFITMALFVTLLFLYKFNIIKSHYRGVCIVTISIILVPLIAIFLKYQTNLPCPSYLEYYNGTYPYVKLFEEQPLYLIEHGSRCWPAGHASLGFGFMSLFFLFNSRRKRFFGLLFGITLGLVMAMYKTLIGDHFISHDIASILLSWIIILIIVKIVDLAYSYKTNIKI